MMLPQIATRQPDPGFGDDHATVRGYDPLMPTEFVSGAEACRGAELVLSVNSAADALDALAQGMPGCAPGTLWADLNTAAPAVKQAVQATARAAGLHDLAAGRGEQAAR